MSPGCTQIKDVSVVIHLFEVGFKEIIHLFISFLEVVSILIPKSCDLCESVVVFLLVNSRDLL